MKTRRHLSRRIRRSGFTLLELLIVLGIILAIAALVVPNLLGQQQQANQQTTMITIKSVEQAAKLYAAQHDGVHFNGGSGQEAWAEFMNPQPYRGRTLTPFLEELPLDAWGRQLQYEWNGDGHSKAANATKPAIWSFGPNGQDDGGEGDDINNWIQVGAADQ